MIRFFVFALLTAAVSVFGTENLIRNADMLETQGENGAPKYWSVKTDKGCGVDTAVTPREGIHSLRVVGSSLCTTKVKVSGGRVYKCSFLLKTEGFQWMTAASFQILWLQDGKPMFREVNGKKQWIMKIRNVQGGHNWTRIELSDCEAPEGATAAEIRLLQVFEPAGTCWFADLRMEEEAPGDPFANRVISIPRVSGLSMDAAPSEEKWKDAAVLDDFLVPHTGIGAKNPTRVRIAFDDEAIWLHAECFQKGVGSAEKKNVRFDTQDALEIFLLPPDREFQYHIMVPRADKLFACTEKWNDGNWPMKLHEWKDNGVESKIVSGEDKWSATVRIPFRGMGSGVPADGTQWRGNVCRSVYSGENEDSAWSALREKHFQYSGDFGKFIFAEKTPLIRSVSITSDGAGAEVTNNGDKPVTFHFALVRQNGDTGSFETASQDVQAAPGETKVMELLNKTEMADMRYVEIRAEGKLIRKHCAMPVKEYLGLSVFDPENVRTQTLYLAVDMPFFMAMNMNHSLETVVPKRAHGLIHRKEKPFDLYMELPKEIKLTGFTFGDGWLKPGLVKPTVTEVERAGVKMNLWKFEMPFIVRWQDNAFIFFYECSGAEGRDLEGSYYFAQDGQVMQKHEMKFHTMKVGRVRKNFRRFLVDPGLLEIKMLTWWFPENTAARYLALGFNWLGIVVEKTRNPESRYEGRDPKSNEDYYDLFFRDVKKIGANVFLKTFITSSGPVSWAWPRKDPDSKAQDAMGKTPVNQYNTPALCPSYRGKLYEEWVERLIRSSAFEKYRITWLGLDLELWPGDVMEKICFCPRCLAQFKEYCEKNGHKDYADRDPKQEFLAKKDKEFAAFWNKFKQHQRSVFISDCAVRVAESVKGAPSTSPWEKFVVSDWTSPGRLDEGTLDLYEVPLYNSPDNNYLKMARVMKNCGYRKDIICSTTFGQTAGCPDFHVSAEQIKDNVYECAAFGMQGISWYYVNSLEPRRMKAAIEALNTLLPLESLILDGKYSEDIRSGNEKIVLTRLVLGDESLIGVRAYGADADPTGTIRLENLKVPVNVYECETGKLLAELRPENPEFSYTAKKHCCRLLYAGPAELWKKRNQD